MNETLAALQCIVFYKVYVNQSCTGNVRREVECEPTRTAGALL